ncbi:MAG TPA: alpha/beta hydrolase [Tepidisphaeraceae bacterium]|jgi:pimeloyl-ACP methyl ester carboxylesterase|nr:alpha/beta hydrolase [Tepidisphaeraceae bacterium]
MDASASVRIGDGVVAVRRPTLVLLSGLDGTGELFGPLLEVIPGDLGRRVIPYPVDQVMSYGEVLELVEGELAEEGEVVLVAESYSGPVALRFAAAHPDRVRAVVLCASFVCSPLPRWLRWLVKPVLFRISPPALALRALMVGRDAPDALVAEVREAIGRVRPEVMAGRLRDVLELECGEALRACAAPVMYLAGARDLLAGKRNEEVIKRIRVDVTVCRLDGPHLLLQTQPAAAWSQIVRFLNEKVMDGIRGSA